MHNCKRQKDNRTRQQLKPNPNLPLNDYVLFLKAMLQNYALGNAIWTTKSQNLKPNLEGWTGQSQVLSQVRLGQQLALSEVRLLGLAEQVRELRAESWRELEALQGLPPGR
tara:strand:+ start:103 stop:435 length:333 start_codon:yes stop_codon:yes gene_type:complete